MHTPGPWGIMPKELNIDEDENYISEPHLGTYVYNTNNTLPGHYGTGAICEHVWSDADARLIAAAPEMFDILKSVALSMNYCPDAEIMLLLKRIEGDQESE